MSYLMFLLLTGLVLGFIAVASNPSPYFAALGLVFVAGTGCGVVAYFGGSFLSLVLFLIYLGGMLVVFAYSAALAAERYPESWVNWPVLVYMGFYLGGVLLALAYFYGGWFEFSIMPLDESDGLLLTRADTSGVALMYSSGCWMLVIGAWALLLTLFVVLELTRGLERGALRAV
uniref:NADH-ubiquinone oxidoreductase chain 6 n=1 Tax=Doryrhamphus japonicus TaxID=1147755 RepID=A0A060NSG3_DORJA|nr:NADH dehydrogenase subunit 6 [Doryrhamphus japonicus]BAO84717.1 NADH dehydrogenase subunit 6 [Doryrhamphus japonicus]